MMREILRELRKSDYVLVVSFTLAIVPTMWALIHVAVWIGSR